MSSEVVRELFRNLENTLHDRLKVIEDILSSTKQTVATNTFDATEIYDRLSVLEGHFKNLDEYTMGQVRTLAFNHDQLEKRVEWLEKSMKAAAESFHVINETIGSLQDRVEEWCEHEQPKYNKDGLECSACIEDKKEEEKPVEAAEVEAEMEEAQEAEAEAEEEVVEEEEEEEVVEEEEEESPYEHIFTYKGSDYFEYKENHNVYIADEDGGIDENDVKGIWNPNTQKMYDLDKKKWWDPKTDKYTNPKPKT